MAKALTDITIQSLKPRAVRYEVPDAGARGLRVVVQPSGRKSFAVRYRTAAGRARKLTLQPGITLAAARKLAADALFEVAQGRDPGSAKQEAKRNAGARANDTVEQLAEQFIERHAKKRTRRNSWRQTIHVFRDIVLPAWKGRVVHDIKRRDIRELLENLAEAKPIMANRTHGKLSKFFNWLCEQDIIAASPITGVKRPAAETPRDRTLNDAEIRRLWLACEAIGGPAGVCFKLLLLTGQRRGEIAGLRWGDFDGDVLTLPVERMKGKRAHIVPLSTQAVTVLSSLPRISDYVFGGKAPLGHFDQIRRALDTHMGDTPKWVTHDLRRSVASGMAKLGVPMPTIEKLLAHHGGSFKGVAGVYQRHSFLPEMAVAVQKWSDHLERLVAGTPGTPGTVLKLPRRR